MATAGTFHLERHAAYRALAAHHEEIAGAHLRELFASDPGRGTRLTAEAAGIHLDYSKNRVTDGNAGRSCAAGRRGRRRRGGATRCSRASAST